MSDKKTRLVFNPALQVETPHEISVDLNGEILFTDPENGHFVKIPTSMKTKTEVVEYLEKYKEANIGQVVVEDQQKLATTLSDELVDDLAE
jgi:histidinol phosphatase-like enzyme